MTIRANGINLYYEKRGKGKELILLHGNGEDHTIFEDSVLLLEKSFTVYAVDTRGHGRSDRTTSFHYSEMAEDIAAFIKRLGIERPIVCGFSDGGITALLLAINYPDLPGMIITCGANTKPEGIKKRALWMMKLSYRRSHSPLTALMLSEPAITAEMLSKIEVPSVIIAGSNDLIKESDTRFIADNIKDSRLLVLKGEDHGSYISHSQKLGYILLELIDNEDN